MSASLKKIKTEDKTNYNTNANKNNYVHSIVERPMKSITMTLNPEVNQSNSLQEVYENKTVVTYNEEEILSIINSLNNEIKFTEITPATLPSIIELIKQSQLSAGEKMALVAKIVNCPDAIQNIVTGTDLGWSYAMKAQTFSKQALLYNILHDMAVNHAYGSCAQALASVVINIYDNNFPYTDPEAQLNYLNSNQDKWENVGAVPHGSRWANIQVGDIVVSEKINGHQHVMLCVEAGDNPLFYEAAATAPEGEEPGFSMYPIISAKEVNDDYYLRMYSVYRPKK